MQPNYTDTVLFLSLLKQPLEPLPHTGAEVVAVFEQADGAFPVEEMSQFFNAVFVRGQVVAGNSVHKPQARFDAAQKAVGAGEELKIVLGKMAGSA